MKILIITDAWLPQTNGVVTTMTNIVDELTVLGHTVKVISPADFWKFPFRPYPDVDVALPNIYSLYRKIKAFKPDSIHIVTEFTLGWMGVILCRIFGWRFTTSYHTKFPEYCYEHYRVSPRLGYAVMRAFHKNSTNVMIATQSLRDELSEKGFRNLVLWNRGVDTKLFHPREKDLVEYPGKPILMYVGRVSYEKNLNAFLSIKTDGTKYIIGDGPARKELETKYPEAIFKGNLKGEALAKAYANADCFIFPSKTDTYGMVILEALASGVPVAAYPVTGPKDIVQNGITGGLDDSLEVAIDTALKCKSDDCLNFAVQHSWESCAKLFLSNLVGV